MKNAPVTAILFDLDGTITDSYAGLQHAFDYAYEQVYRRPSSFNIRSLVGPPMRQIFKKVTGEEDAALTDEFIRQFQAKYDTESYRMDILFAGMADLLQELHEAGIKLYIATNKRAIPTGRVLANLNIAPYFKAVYSIDSVQPPYPEKTLMVADILQAEQLKPEETLFIGDTLHDQKAAVGNGLKFIYARYGFGQLDDELHSIEQASELRDYLTYGA